MSPLVTTGLLCPLCLWTLVCFLRTVRRRAGIELGKGESSHVSCDTSIGKSKQE